MFQYKQTVNDVDFEYNTEKATIYIITIVLSFLLYIPFPWWKTEMFTRQFKVKMGKSTVIILSMKEICRLWREAKTLPSISSFIHRVFFNFRQKIVRV